MRRVLRRRTRTLLRMWFRRLQDLDARFGICALELRVNHFADFAKTLRGMNLPIDFIGFARQDGGVTDQRMFGRCRNSV